MIQFNAVTFTFPGAAEPVLRDISLTIQDGEQVAVMGKNGCGKTTMGMLLAGILLPDSGDIIVTSNGDSDKKPVIGYLFQDPDNGLVATTVEREVAFALENQNMPVERMRPLVDDTLDTFHLKEMSTRLVWELSGGEKQRLSLAGLIAASPDVLFLDEPSSYLDYRGNLVLQETLRQISERNPHIIIIRITQFAGVAEEYPRLLLLGQGTILRDDRPEVVFSDSALMTAARLSPPLKYRPEVLTGENETSDAIDKSRAGEAIMTFEDVRFSYDGEQSLLFDGLCLTLHANEVLALVGSSGAGKSTLAQLACGIYTPDAGHIDKKNRAVRATMCFQQPERQFYMETVYDEVSYGVRRENESDTSIDAVVRASLKLAGLDADKFLQRDPRSLSGGEARRLAFAILLALDSDIIIFDEPTCGLDDEGITGFLRTVDLLRRNMKSVVIISHNSDVILETADRIVALAEKKAVYDGSVWTFFTRSEFKELLETPQVISCQINELGDVDETRCKSIRLWGEFST